MGGIPGAPGPGGGGIGPAAPRLGIDGIEGIGGGVGNPGGGEIPGRGGGEAVAAPLLGAPEPGEAFMAGGVGKPGGICGAPGCAGAFARSTCTNVELCG